MKTKKEIEDNCIAKLNSGELLSDAEFNELLSVQSEEGRQFLNLCANIEKEWEKLLQ